MGASAFASLSQVPHQPDGTHRVEPEALRRRDASADADAQNRPSVGRQAPPAFQEPGNSFEYIPNGDQEYIHRLLEDQNLRMQMMNSQIHRATSSAPEIDRLIEETRRTPFTDRIADAVIRDFRKIRFPQYDGEKDSDPRAFVKAFRLAITQANLTPEEKEPALCRFFAENLRGVALDWFSSLRTNSIDGFEQLVKAFLKQFSIYVKEDASEADLWPIIQGEKEPLRSHIEKLKKVRAQLPDLNHEIALKALENGLSKKTDFFKEVALNPPKNFDDALHRATRFIKLEEALAASEPGTSKMQAPSNGQKQKNHNNHKSGPQGNQKEKTQGEHAFAVKDEPVKQDQSKNAQGTGDSSNTQGSKPERIFRPYDPTKHCIHHAKAGHSTEECAEVQKQLARLFASGELKDVVLSKKPPYKGKQSQGEAKPAEESQKRDRPPEKDTDSPPPPATRTRKRIDAVFKDLSLTGGSTHSVCTPPPAPKKKQSQGPSMPRFCGGCVGSVAKSINFILGGSNLCDESINSIKTHQRKVESSLRLKAPLQGPNTKISFWESETHDLDSPHDDALVIELEVDGCELTKMMVDTGSSVDLIFYEALKKMEIPDSRINGHRSLLTGFAGETTVSMGTIRLQVIASGVEKMVDFVVVDRKAPFHAILGRPWIHLMKAVASTYHQCVKFPAPEGIATIHGSQKTSRICYMRAFEEAKGSVQ